MSVAPQQRARDFTDRQIIPLIIILLDAVGTRSGCCCYLLEFAFKNSLAMIYKFLQSRFFPLIITLKYSNQLEQIREKVYLGTFGRGDSYKSDGNMQSFLVIF